MCDRGGFSDCLHIENTRINAEKWQQISLLSFFGIYSCILYVAAAMSLYARKMIQLKFQNSLREIVSGFSDKPCHIASRILIS